MSDSVESKRPEGAPSDSPVACPQCGFDMEPGKACRVCGWASGATAGAVSSTAPAAKAGQATAGKPRMAKSARIGILVGLLAVIVAVFLLVKFTASPADPAPAAADAKPAATAAESSAVTAAPAAAAPGAAPGAAPAAAATTADPLNFVGTTDLPPFDITTRTPRPTFTSRETFISWYLEHSDQKEKFLGQRWDRMQVILSQGHVKSLKTVDAWLATPRELFSRDLNRAYDDAALPIGYGQTISGPHLVAHMTDYLSVQPEHKVLEIGTGSGYQAAVLSQLSNHVYTIEIVKELAASTDQIYRGLVERYPEYRNVRRKMADGYYGWKEYAPFDRIIVTCGIDHIPPSLLEQMAPEAIMLIPVGPPSGQTVLRIVKHVAADGSVTLDREDIYQGRHKPIFVPFTGGGSGKGNP